MKLVNHINNNYLYLFDCVVRGKIILTSEEWKKSLKYLKSNKVKKQFLPSYPWTNTMLLEDIDNKLKVKDGYLINIRVPMTRILVDYLKLNRYKQQNYVIMILND